MTSDAIHERARAIARAVRRDLEKGAGGPMVLVAGQAGSGKSAAMEIFADELGARIYRVYLDRVVRKSIGETEKNLNKVFDAAERAGVILLFDEADALFGKRTDVGDAHDRYANVSVAQLLRAAREHAVVVMLATSRPQTLSRELNDAIGHRLELPRPQADRENRVGSHEDAPNTDD